MCFFPAQTAYHQISMFFFCNQTTGITRHFVYKFDRWNLSYIIIHYIHVTRKVKKGATIKAAVFNLRGLGGFFLSFYAIFI